MSTPTFTEVYRKTGTSGTAADYELVAQVGVGGVPLSLMGAATGDADGTQGLVPAPVAGDQNKYLRGDGTWGTPTNTTYGVATTTTNGLMSSTDKGILNALDNNVTYLGNLVGNTDISSIGGGTITGAINTLNSNTTNLSTKIGSTSISSIGNGTVTGAISKLNSRVSHMGHYCTIPLLGGQIKKQEYLTIPPSSAGSTSFFEWFTSGGINLNYAGYYLVNVYLNIENANSPYNSITAYLQYHDNVNTKYTVENNGYFCGGVTANYASSSSGKGAGLLSRMVYASTDDYRLLLQVRNNSGGSKPDVITVNNTSFIQIMYLGHENI